MAKRRQKVQRDDTSYLLTHEEALEEHPIGSIDTDTLIAFFRANCNSRDAREKALASVAFEELCTRSGCRVEY
jgi:hypothetical protein